MSRLKLAWSFTPHPAIVGNEDYPVIVGNTAYVTTQFGDVFALNATTGQELWSYNPGPGVGASAHGFPNRGVAVGEGMVFVLTPDAHLVALQATTGHPVYNIPLADPKWYTESTAPVYYNGVLYIGSSAADTGARGFEEARLARNGKLLWQHFNVPRAGAPGSWLYGHHGGGTVWMPPILDPKDGVMYYATGNPSPDFYGLKRPGPDPYTDSVLAVRMANGQMLWAYQEVPHDLWDYDAASPPVLFPTAIGPAVGEAGKDGYWYELSARTGQLITFPASFVKEDHVAPPVTGKPVVNWPGDVGGSEWSPVPYDPQTGYTYVEGVNSPGLEKAANVPFNGGLDFGTIFLPVPKVKPTGTLTAFDTGSGQVAWQVNEPVAMVGGSTATAGGLLFVGVSGTGRFEAVNARTGQVLWSYRLPGRIDDAASVYSVNGVEYVLIGVGGALTAPQFGGMGQGPAAFYAFRLG